MPAYCTPARNACSGNPSCSFTRVKRSSPAANTTFPLITRETVASLSRGEIPSTIINSPNAIQKYYERVFFSVRSEWRRNRQDPQKRSQKTSENAIETFLSLRLIGHMAYSPAPKTDYET